MWSSKDYWVNAESERNKGLCNSEGTRTLAGVGPDIKIGLFTCEGARTLVNVGSDINSIVKEQGQWLVLDLTSK